MVFKIQFPNFQKIQVYLSLGSKRQEKTTGVLEIFAVNLQVTSRLQDFMQELGLDRVFAQTKRFK